MIQCMNSMLLDSRRENVLFETKSTFSFQNREMNFTLFPLGEARVILLKMKMKMNFHLIEFIPKYCIPYDADLFVMRSILISHFSIVSFPSTDLRIFPLRFAYVRPTNANMLPNFFNLLFSSLS